jgi:NAD(P)-dependent dehydrogenase (short-subunit alcohol dehydrogenase family)
LVTGGARGIGLGISQALAADRWDVALCGTRPEEDAAEALESLSRAGAEVLYVRADIGDDGTADLVIQAVRRRFGRLDALVNNAGVAPKERRDILEATRESFDRLVRINLRGPYFLTQAAARWMIEQRSAGRGQAPGSRRTIVFITSVSAQVASINRGDYCISKAGLSMAAMLWAVRLADHGIPVYEVQPGVIRTDMTAGVADKYDRMLAEGLTLERRWGTPADVGRTVAMLLRGDLPYATGAVLPVDGGLLTRRM